LLCAAIFDALVPLSPFIAQDMNVDASAFQELLATAMLGFSLCQFFSGRLISSFDLQKILASSTFLVAILVAGITVLSNFRLFSLVLISMFGANAVAAVSSRALLRNVLDHQHFQKLTAFVYAGMSGVAVFTPFVLVTLTSVSGWRWPIAMLALLLLAIAVALRLASFDHLGEKADSAAFSTRPTTRNLLRNPSLIHGLIIAFTAQTEFTYLMINKPFLLKDFFHLSAGQWGQILSALAAVTAIGFYMSGKLLTEYGEHHRLVTGMLCQLSAALLLSITHFFPDLAVFIAASVLASLNLCILLPLASGWSLDVPAGERAYASALFGTIQGGVTASVIFTGSLFDFPPLLKLSVVGAACTCITAGLIVFRKRFSRHEEAVMSREAPTQ